MNTTSSLPKRIIWIGIIFMIGFAAAICIVKSNRYIYSILAPPPTACNANGNLIQDQAEAKALRAAFVTTYPSASFYEKGGIIPKSVLCALYVSMTDPNDTKVYYYFGRSRNNQNLLMLFGDPTYHINISGDAYKTLQYCPPECNADLETYLR